MALELISEKAPLIYYSFRQSRIKDSGQYEINAANKVSIRKNSDFERDGLEFLIYNCALSKTPELCDGIRYTTIDRDMWRRVDFYGKGVSGNGISLADRMGVFNYENDLPDVAFGKQSRKDIYVYHNFYSEYNSDVFAINPTSVKEFLDSTYNMLNGHRYDPINNSWFAIRSFVINYYSKLYNVSPMNLGGISLEESQNYERTVGLIDRCSLLKQLENMCDERAHDAYQDYQRENKVLFKKKLENMVSLLGTYYILYRTLV